MNWIDERLQWNPYSYGGISWTHFQSSQIWIPHLALITSSLDMQYLHRHDHLLTVYYNGVVVWTPGDSFESNCNVDIRRYPYDRHTCNLTYVAWGLRPEEMDFAVTGSNFISQFYVENNRWELMGADMIRINKSSSQMIGYDIRINVKRRPNFIMINMVTPIFFMSLSNLMVFCLPADSGERVGFAITILLAISVFLTIISDTLPQTSSPSVPMVSYLLLVMFLVSLLILVFVILGLRLYLANPDTRMPNWIRNMVMCVNHRKWKKRKNAVGNGEIVLEDNVRLKDHISKDMKSNITINDAFVDCYTAKITWKDAGEAFDKIACGLISVMLFTSFVILAFLFVNTDEGAFKRERYL